MTKPLRVLEIQEGILPEAQVGHILSVGGEHYHKWTQEEVGMTKPLRVLEIQEGILPV
jgi:hypothetical protein